MLLCYLLLFLLLVLHLYRAEDRCDTAPDGAQVVSSSSSDGSAASTGINTPILQHSATVVSATAALVLNGSPTEASMPAALGASAEAKASPPFPEIECRWQRVICIAAAVSAAINVLGTLLPVFGEVAGTLVILGIDWSGVLAGLLYFLTKAVAGGVWLLLKPRPRPAHTLSCSALGIVVALFSAILVPACLSTGAVELLPQLRVPAMAPALLVGSVLVAVILALVGLCCVCRRTRA